MSKIIQRIENNLTARIGVYAKNLGDNRIFSYRSTERFAMCSTFKVSLAAECLRRCDAGELDLEDKLSFDNSMILPTSPITEAYTANGSLDIRALCQAVVEYSDNTAANLLLQHIGGPPAVTRLFRKISDDVSRLDRTEMDLNSNLPGDLRDTTSPQSMAQNLVELLVSSDTLNASSREMLIGWMQNEQNGKDRIRAAAPANWSVANKPGTTSNGAANDIALLKSSDGEMLAVTIYIDTTNNNTDKAISTICDIAKAAISEVY